MAGRWDIIRLAVRAAIWRPTPHADAPGTGTLILAALAGIVSALAYEYVAAGAAPRFVPYGLNATVTASAVSLAVTALFVRGRDRMILLTAITLLSVPLNLASAALFLAGRMLLLPRLPLWGVAVFGVGSFLLIFAWWYGAMFNVMRVFTQTWKAAALRTGGLWIALVVAVMALPYEPAFRGRDFDIRSANLWEYIPRALAGAPAEREPKLATVNRAWVELAQPALMETAISHLAPQIKGKTDVYAIGIAGSSDMGVFAKELDGGLAALGRVLPLEGHVLRLVNNVDTVDSIPAASRQNFAAAVHAVARVMDRDNDVLVLLMTSHGAQQGFALWLNGAFNVALAPREVAAVLNREGIKNRIIIVSACYSGVFLKPLANDNSIVLTAADDKHPSFGCSNEREWTYFGDAFFNRALEADGDIEAAFGDAKASIAEWEAHYKLEPSNPQGHFGRALTAKLASVYLKSAHKQAMRAEQ